MRALALATCIVLMGCESATTTARATSPQPQPADVADARQPAQPEPDPRFVHAIRDAAANYRGWSRVDHAVRQAPELCAAPVMRAGPKLRRSAAASGAHGKKLYYLWATDRDAYTKAASFAAGFAVIKESYAAIPAAPDSSVVFIDDKGERTTTGERTELFVMTKLADPTNTDEGWIYGTVTVDGAVTGAGRIASCMSCHDRDAKRERLFGLTR